MMNKPLVTSLLFGPHIKLSSYKVYNHSIPLKTSNFIPDSNNLFLKMEFVSSQKNSDPNNTRPSE